MAFSSSPGDWSARRPSKHRTNRRQAEERGEASLEVWDRERLIELLCASPDAGLSGVAEAPLLELIAHIESGEITEIELESYSTRWICDRELIPWRSIVESGLIATRLREADRLDLACFCALALLRAVWASAHGAGEPPDETFESQAMLARELFISHAPELWAQCGENELDPRELIAQESEGVFLPYPVRCLRLMEMLGMYGLAIGAEDKAEIASWLARFVERQPGAAHPISDRWAVSMIPALLLIRTVDKDIVEPYLRRVITWLGDAYEGEAAGLASYHADPQEEADFLLGGSLEHVPHVRRGGSYIATVALDLAAAFELSSTYDIAFNDVEASDLTPVVPLPNDDRSQYLISGHDVDVPMNTSPKYAERYAEGDDWRMASHHDDHLSRYLLGRIGRLWDALAVSIVTRDRHWVALLRTL